MAIRRSLTTLIGSTRTPPSDLPPTFLRTSKNPPTMPEGPFYSDLDSLEEARDAFHGGQVVVVKIKSKKSQYNGHHGWITNVSEKRVTVGLVLSTSPTKPKLVSYLPENLLEMEKTHSTAQDILGDIFNSPQFKGWKMPDHIRVKVLEKELQQMKLYALDLERKLKAMENAFGQQEGRTNMNGHPPDTISSLVPVHIGSSSGY